MLICLAIVGAGFLSALGWYGANAYVIDPYLKQLPVPPAVVKKGEETPKPQSPETK